MWDLIVSVPDHCLSFYFLFSKTGGFMGIQYFCILAILWIFFDVFE